MPESDVMMGTHSLRTNVVHVMGRPIPMADESLPVHTTTHNKELLRSLEHDGV